MCVCVRVSVSVCTRFTTFGYLPAPCGRGIHAACAVL